MIHVPRANASISDALIVYQPGPLGPQVFTSRIVDKGTEVPGRLHFIDLLGLADGAQLGHATTLIEPGGLFPTEIPDVHRTDGPYSDVFGVFLVGGAGGPVVRLAFVSDGDPTGIGAKGNDSSFFVFETGAPVDATKYLDPFRHPLGVPLVGFAGLR